MTNKIAMKAAIIKLKNLIIVLLFSINGVFAQTPPYISSIDKTNASTNESLLIIGLDFPTNAANLVVKFGAAHATVVSTSSTLIEVQVPANSTLDNISVTDTSTGLTAYSNEVFAISHGGNSFSTSDLDPIQSIPTTFVNTFDLCMCDFDNNGTNDIVTTNNESNSINIFTNNSTTTTISLANGNIDLGTPSVNVTCGDLDGDGKSDLVVTRGGGSADRFFVLRNTSPGAGTISFDNAGKLAIQLPVQEPSLDVRSPKRPVIQDVDLDGKPDLILTNDADNNIFIYKNNSSGSVSLESTPTQIEIAEISLSSGLDVKDLNNDGFPEIIFIDDVAPNIHILPNNSEPGTISMGNVSIFNVSGNFRNLKSGDLNQDGFNDIVATNQAGGTIAVLENSTVDIGGTITFSAPSFITNTSSVWGVDLFDVEGDGDLDIVAASISRSIYILVNNNPTNLTFQTENIGLSEFVRNIKAGDINGDGKPDLAFTYKSGDGEAGELGLITNRNCVVPVVAPSGPREICTGTTLRLEATGALDATYDWLRDNVSVKTGSDNFLDVTGTPGTYKVTVSDGLASGCSRTSNEVTITLGTDPNVTTTAGNDTGGTPQCIGNTVNLSTNSIAGGTYTWTGPNGFTSSDQNPVLSNITADMAGTYTVFAEANGCVSNESSTVVLVETVPVVSVQYSSQDTFCEGSSIQLNVTEPLGTYNYKWKKDGTDIDPAQTNTTLTVTEPGDYSIVITSTNGCTLESTSKPATRIPVPTPSFTASDAGSILSGSNSSICVNLPIDFTATSSDGGSGFTINNAWNFGDGSTDPNSTNITHTYTTAGNVTATLTATYPDVQNCSTTEQVTQDFTITDVPVVTISTPGDITEKCPSEALRLSISSDFSNYAWSSGENTSFIDVLDPGVYSVSATDQFGCDFTSADATISNFASSGIDITSTSTIDPVTRTIDVTEGQMSVELTVNNAIANIAWIPSSVIEDTTQTTVTVFIQDINTLVTVFGDDAQGCQESDTVRILNSNIRAKRVFSPNGDGIGDECWEITNSRSDVGFTDCTIFIFDSKGRIVQQQKGPFVDDCVWEGNINGSPAPEGVYYYALKCSDSALSLTGSILLGR